MHPARSLGPTPGPLILEDYALAERMVVRFRLPARPYSSTKCGARVWRIARCLRAVTNYHKRANACYYRVILA